jgi:hypothetical protein
MISKVLIPLLIASAIPLHAAPRIWTSADGQRSVQGEFVKRDASRVTILRADRKEVFIPLEQLHSNDRKWLDANHPDPTIGLPPSGDVFDQLRFGDKRAVVLEKLKASQFVELTAPEVMLSRVGMNGVFRTRKKIGGLDASLFFDWTEDGGLKEITLQTTALPAAKFIEQLQPCWKEFIGLLTALYGKPINASEHLDLSSIADGGMSATHLWKLEGSGTAMLGAAREANQYLIAVRFTLENIQPVRIPAPPAGG